ncbi:MAG TPA: amino acid adenylation domain-containing protein [Candidatus Angelobacter sp.]|nr:amino acid adenylation domain-containing protein [Candidatus Angelobacter sp.]
MLKKDRLEEERELLRRLLEKEGLSAPTAEPAPVVPQEHLSPCSAEASEEISSLFPLSFQQEQLWFLDRFLPSSDFYNVGFAWRFKGDMDVDRLQRSLKAMVRRHEVLRTCFVMGADEEPKQKVVGERYGLQLPVVDLRNLEADEREKQAKAVIAEEAGKSFDLAQAPLLRAVLVRMGENEHVLGLTLHHIICDEWSLGVLLEELGKLYEADASGEESPLPELGMQYGDYAMEQREALGGGRFQQQMEYWKEQLKGMPQVLELPTDHVRRVQQSFRGGILDQGFESNLLEGLNALGRAEGTSLFMTLLAAFQVLLMRYSGQEDLGVGTSIANRGRTNTQGLIGFFLNTLVMRANLSGEPAFRDVLRQVRQTALSGYEHQDLPFEKLVKELAPDRDLSRNPLIQVMFTVRRPIDPKFGRFELTEFGTDIRTSKFDLSMIVEDSRQPKIAINYSSDLFEAETIVRMLGHYEQLLKAIVKNPDQEVWELPLLTDHERSQLEKWNQTSKDYDRERNIAEMFEQCAARMPNASAVEYEGQALTYGELNRRANRLAHYLRELGVQAEQRVAICLERSLEMVVGLVAVLKAGGAYVPMDPEYPQELLHYILHDSAPSVLLTQQHLRTVWGGISEKIVVVDINDAGRFSHQPDSSLLPVSAGLKGGHLAYLIYTSGSTGKPKGVMVSHQNLVSATLARKLAYGNLGSFLLLSSISFDSSVAGIFGSLVCGGTLIIATRDVVRDPFSLNQMVQQRGVESLLCVPSLYKHFLEYPIPREQKKLSRVIVAGEVCPSDLVAKSAQEEPQVELFNEYGPTEGTVWATMHRCVYRLSGQPVPIGRPIANTRVYILNEREEPVPIGVVGELHIGGAGVARGYWNQPELTAERFVPDPFTRDVTARMYKTGDLGRWRADGTIEFIGRNDAQVKIRGYRVELEEIERVLREQVWVKEAVVTAQEHQARGKELVAYVVEKSQANGLPQEVEDFSTESKRVAEFTRLYDDLYGRDEAYVYPDQGVNALIWSSSYTNQPLGEEEIAESVTETVKSIRELEGRRVLEIGCGTGLLLSRIAPQCDAYWGLDVSAEALRRLRAQLREKPEFSHVMLLERAAHQLDGLAAEKFDCVVLNEVVQHFSDLDYLMKVLKKAAELIGPRGTIFLGGMRNLHLLEAFHSGVQIFQARDSIRLDGLRQKIQQQMQREKDLVVAPEFFARINTFLPHVTAAQVRLKRGEYRNEITCFKYDVTLYVGYERVDPADCREMAWEPERWSIRELEQWVREKFPDLLRIKGVPNARLAKENELLKLMGRKDSKSSVAEIRRILSQRTEKEGGIDPGEFWSLEQRMPYKVEVSWNKGGHNGAYDVILKKQGLLSGDFVILDHDTPKEGRAEKAWTAAEFANRPVAETRVTPRFSRQMIEELRRSLKEKLPEHMIPSLFVKLETLPLTANGKVDRQALPEVGELDSNGQAEEYQAPRAGVEEQLAEIWAAVLGVTRVGRHDHFFRSGGHSLLATSMASRFRNIFGIDVPVRTIFESPTLAELAVVIERDLKLQGTKVDRVIAPTPVPSISRPSLFPLSYQQEQLWFLDRFQPRSDFYNAPLAWNLKGDLDVFRLQRSLQEIIRRHEILRTCFVMGEDEEPKQQVAAEKLDLQLQVLDLRSLEAGKREEEAKSFLTAEGAKVFDLSQAPLLRAALVRTAEKEHVLGLTLHHIICDDWSLGVLMTELGKLYAAYGRGEESPLPELGMQYGDYALEQREALRGDRFQQQMGYWKKQLKGMPQVLELPTDMARPVRQNFRGRSEQQVLRSDLVDRLNALGREEKASLFMTLLAVLQILLMRYTGQEDFGVGTPVANRKRIETEQMIGFFLNTLVIRANLGVEPTFREVLRRVRETALSAYEHQDLAFEKLVQELAPDRDTSRTPIFQVMFTTLGEPNKLELGDLELSGFALDLDMSKFDLTVSVDEISQGAAVTINYASDLFEAETIRRMLGHYEQLLKAVVENPAQRAWDLPLLTRRELTELKAWNETAKEYPSNKTIAELFEEHAARTPNAVAVEHEGHELKYGDLNQQANRLANHLRSMGIKPDTVVAVCVDRSLEMIVALIAVMKAGGAYLPLDPEYPEDRLRFMLQDSRPAVLLTQKHLCGVFRQVEGLKVIDLEGGQAWSDQGDSNLEHTAIGLSPHNLIYVIYTSGSTGMPKGVAMPVRAAMNMLAWQISESAWAGPQRTLQFAALGFDVSFQEIFSTLCSGGTLVLINEEKRRNSTEITRYVMEKSIQRLFLPFVGLQMLADGIAQIGTASRGKELSNCALQEINVAGEQLRIDDKIRGLFQRLPACRLNNHYGPTETHAASAFHLGTETDRWPLLPSIGQPISNAQIYILDKHQQFVPVGVIGELYIGGAGIARGYLNRPELESKRFLKDPFAKQKGARMYRSGDLGRWRPDGTIEFIGRNDSQVKIRGYRVELGEIEAMLQQQSGVTGCAVVVKTGANGSKRLVAYVVGERKHEDLRRDLKGKLPTYMIPSAIVELQALPLSGNGKVDREALEKLEDLGSGTEHYEVPHTAVEEQLAEIWAETLELGRVGRNDNFFDLGGHSLLATLLATRMENSFGIEVPVRAIFESPTIAELADVIESGLKLPGRKSQGNNGFKPSQIAAALRPSLFPLSYQQEQLWFLDRFNPGNAFYNIPLAWRLKGGLDVFRLERSLQEVVRRHEILRTCFVMDEHQEPRQKVIGQLDVKLPIMDLKLDASDREEHAKRILSEEAGKAFDLGDAPLMRAALVQIEDRDHVLGLTLHHIICDDWSLGVLMQELWKLYEAYGRGERAPLPELEMQYGEYALEQREWLRGGKLQQQMEYWKRQLAGMPHVLELPTDHVRPARETFRGGTEQRILPGDLLEGLNALGKAEKASLLITMLAAFQVLLMRYSGQEDFGIGTVVANRKRKETKGLIGFFLNTLVIRANLSGEPSFRDVLRRVREAVLAGYEHQDLPFEKLVEDLAPNRDVSRSPVFQVAFTLRRGAAGNSELTGLELAPFELDPGTSKFDLIMGIDEASQSAAASLNYSRDLFEPDSMRQILQQYERLLKGIAADPDQPIWALPMMSELEEKIMSGWNSAVPVSRPQSNIIQLFDAQAEYRPRDLVVPFGETELTYGELISRTNQLGHYLVRMGVAPESVVGIFMPNSQEMVAVMGVLKAGGAYLSLDIQNPKDRLRSIIESSRIDCLLTVEGLRNRLPQTNAPVVCLDAEWGIIGQKNAINHEIQINPQNLACVAYTGTLEEHGKVLMIEHSGLMDLLSCDKFSESGKNGHARENVSSDIWSRLTSSSFLVSSSAFLTSVEKEEESRLRPTGTAGIYILDSYLQRVAIGVPGELWIAGSAAGRGYLGQPSLTAEKFLPNPFSSEIGARMRGTGQQARYRKDGTIELLGRLDDQIEIEGFQVDVGEIEAALVNYESVREVAVVVRPGGELVAYVVVPSGKRLGQNDLRNYLDEKLPPYMIPIAFITLQKLPRNARGAVDRGALSVLGQEQLRGEFVLPRSELEKTIALAWQAILGIDQVGVHDNFFDLGGHSLLMIQLHQKLRAELAVDIELLHLFQFPTIDALVRFLHTGYNFEGKSRETRERAGRQKSAVQKFRRMQTQ